MDLIDRQAAIDKFEPWLKVEGYSEDELNVLKAVLYELRIMPSASAQPEQKKGGWMLGFNNQYLEKYYYCSHCGCRQYIEHKPLDNFCPNCGADMRGERNGRDS